MTTQEKIFALADLFDVDPNILTPDTLLNSLEEYNSMSKLSLIVLMDEEFNKELSGEQLREFKSVKDILDFME